MRLRAVRALLAVVLGSVVLSGCDFNVYKLPLPGGTDVGSNPITVKVMFTDVLDLVPKSTVKVNDVSVGQITDIDLQGYTAVVTMQLRNNTRLPDNATAEIRQTSLLGEKFVSLAAPAEGASPNPLANGDVIPLERAGRNPEIEEVLGALSLVLNGGGVAQLRTIAQELNKALAGREDSARSVLEQIDTLTTNLDDNKADIVSAIEALNRLALAASKQLPTIDKALAELPSALTSIDAQRADLVKMLKALDDLSDVGRDPQVARNLHVGDYTNLDVKLNIDLSKVLQLPTALPIPLGLPGAVVDAVTKCLQTANPLSAECTSLVGTKVLIDYCNAVANKDDQFCKLISPLLIGLPAVPGLPALPGAGAKAPSAGGTTAAPVLPSLPALSQLPLVGGLFRAGTGWTAPKPDGTGGPTVAQLQTVFDPDLVSLMVPGMVGGQS